MSVKLLTEHYLEFLSLEGGCTGSFESTLVKMPHCWKSHVAAHMDNAYFFRMFLLARLLGLNLVKRGVWTWLRLPEIGKSLFEIEALKMPWKLL